MADPSLAAVAIETLPHRGSAHLVERVVAADPGGMTAIARFPAANALCRQGRVPTYSAVEPAAQTAAVHLAAMAMRDGNRVRALEGFLTGVKNMTIARPWLPVDADLLVRIVPRGSARGLHRYAFEVELDGALACSGELSTFVKATLG